MQLGFIADKCTLSTLNLFYTTVADVYCQKHNKICASPSASKDATGSAGEKTIFKSLGVGRDRDAIDVRQLVLGIPAMLADIKERSHDDYQKAIRHLAGLMHQPDTELKRLSDWLYRYSSFPHAGEHQRQMAEGLWQHFQDCHPNAVPTCPCSATNAGQAEVCTRIFNLNLPLENVLSSA